MSKYDNLQLYTQKDWEEREIEHQAELRILRDEITELKRKAKIIKVGNLIPPDFAPLSISMSILNLEDPESAYLYGWESAVFECGETLS